MIVLLLCCCLMDSNTILMIVLMNSSEMGILIMSEVFCGFSWENTVTSEQTNNCPPSPLTTSSKHVSYYIVSE